MTTATFERQAELLETIHRCKRELQELVGDTLVITIEPAKKNGRKPGKPKASRRRPAPAPRATERGTVHATRMETARQNREAVLDVFKQRPNEWIAIAEVIELTGITRNVSSRIFKGFHDDGTLEHNGQLRRAARYRLHAGGLPEEEWPHTNGNAAAGKSGLTRPQLDEDINDQGGEDEDYPADTPEESAHARERGQTQAMEPPITPPASDLPSSLSSRTRKSIERADREQENGGGQAQNRPPLHARILDSLREEAGTVTELAMRLDIPRRDIAAAIEALRDEGHILHCGVRFPRRHKVYGVAE